MILFDLDVTQPSGGAKRHGGGIYGEIVFKRILQRKLDVCCFYNSKKWMNPEIKEIIEINNVKLYDIASQSIPEIMTKSGSQRIYCALPYHIDYKDLGYEIYTTIHGLRALEEPADTLMFRYQRLPMILKLKYMIKKMAPKIGYKKAKEEMLSLLNNKNLHFVVVSNHTKYAIYSFFPDIMKDIKVFYSPSTVNYIVSKPDRPSNYFLIVSANRWQKNALRAIMAFDNLFSVGIINEYQVKVTGCESPNEFSYKLRNPQRFDFLGYVSDEELASLYANAYCLLYPSLNEGFGYPPLEAMFYGVPVICAAFSSVSEICEGAVMYTNPFSVEEIMNRILQMLDPDKRKEFSFRSLAQYDKIYKKQQRDLDLLIDYIYSGL